jgi:lysophospholipase L1-like esterase
VSLPWKRFAALGDSLTEGVGDPDRRGGLRGWANRLAEAMATVEPDLAYVNLARRGLPAGEVYRTQLQPALAFRPDLASVLVGMNDLLEPRFDPSVFERELSAIVRPLRESGAVVLTGTFPDVTLFSPLPKRFLTGIRARLRAASEAVRSVAERDGAVVLDLEALPDARQRQVMSIDRLHPSPRGHVLLAGAFAGLLEEHAGVPIPRPQGTDLAGRVHQLAWLLRQFRPTEVARFVYRFYLAPRSPGGAWTSTHR